MALPVLVLNRAQDTDRLAAFRASAAAFGIEPMRIAALDAHRPGFPFALHADLLRKRFWDSDRIKPGAIGCFLSHRLAWQHVVDHDLPMALICEDDARFVGDPARLPLLTQALPTFDLMFANGRLAAWCAASGEYDLKPLDRVISDLAALGGPKAQGLKPTPGGDCYLVSRHGAEALLTRTAEQGIVCGVDWAMIWNGLGTVTPDAAASFPELQILSAHPAPDPLEAFVLSSPIADQAPGDSVLKHSVTRPIAELTCRDADLTHVESISTITLAGVALNFACRAGPDPVAETLRSGHLWDEPGLTALLRRFPQGGTCVDIGAHCGSHAVAMARLGAAARIIAIEPNDEVHKLLRTNMAINAASHVLDLLPPGVALAGKPGTGWLLRNRKRPSESMVKPERAENADPRTVAAVELRTGDSLLADAEIHALKIDTAGSEVDVVKGLTGTLARCRPLILLDHAAQSLERIQRLAGEIGYRIDATLPSGRKNRASSLLIPSPTAAR